MRSYLVSNIYIFTVTPHPYLPVTEVANLVILTEKLNVVDESSGGIYFVSTGNRTLSFVS